MFRTLLEIDAKIMRIVPPVTADLSLQYVLDLLYCVYHPAPVVARHPYYYMGILHTIIFQIQESSETNNLARYISYIGKNSDDWNGPHIHSTMGSGDPFWGSRHHKQSNGESVGALVLYIFCILTLLALSTLLCHHIPHPRKGYSRLIFPSWLNGDNPINWLLNVSI